MNCNEIRRYYNECRYGDYAYGDSKVEIPEKEKPVNSEYGYIEINITENLGRESAKHPVLTIYVNKDGQKVPVKRLYPVQNPTLIELPMAHPNGTLVESPEYYFTPYDLTIESEGHYKIITQNIRLFPNIKSLFVYNLNDIIPGELNHDEITIFPPHPRDIM